MKVAIAIVVFLFFVAFFATLADEFEALWLADNWGITPQQALCVIQTMKEDPDILEDAAIPYCVYKHP